MRLTALLLAPMLLSAAEPTPRPSSPTAAEGRHIIQTFYRGNLATIWPRFNKQLQDLFQSSLGFEQFRRKVVSQWGKETRLLMEEVETPEGFRTYRRVAEFSRSTTPIELKVTFDRSNRIIGFMILPRSAPPES